MTPHDELGVLLLDLGRAGIELALHPTEPARLRHRPADMAPSHVVALKTHRAAVLALLVNGYSPACNTDAGYVMEERLGIAEGLGLPTQPGSTAWLMAVGESLGYGCEIATQRLHSPHGSTDQGNCGGGAGERSNALRDRQGRGGSA